MKISIPRKSAARLFSRSFSQKGNRSYRGGRPPSICRRLFERRIVRHVHSRCRKRKIVSSENTKWLVRRIPAIHQALGASPHRKGSVSRGRGRNYRHVFPRSEGRGERFCVGSGPLQWDPVRTQIAIDGSDRRTSGATQDRNAKSRT